MAKKPTKPTRQGPTKPSSPRPLQGPTKPTPQRPTKPFQDKQGPKKP
ncbi:hypothetical protein KAR91_18650 [Candidatus Pacearchaeota archaeon]|nr:hypothetical protein [Candidatus Pacearchaeota archaeon]